MKNLKETIEDLDFRFTELNGWEDEVEENGLVIKSIDTCALTEFVNKKGGQEGVGKFTEKEVCDTLKQLGVKVRVREFPVLHFYVNVEITEYHHVEMFREIEAARVKKAADAKESQLMEVLYIAEEVINSMRSWLRVAKEKALSN